jgi:hypothetical protein
MIHQDEAVTYEYMWRWEKKLQMKCYKALNIETINISEWVEYLISLQGSMKWTLDADISEENQENIRREVKKSSNQIEDKLRDQNKIIDIRQGDMEGVYEITILDVVTGIKSESKVSWPEDVREIDLNNNKKCQGRGDATQDDLLLLRPILKNVDSK